MNWPTLAATLTLANGERPLFKKCTRHWFQDGPGVRIYYNRHEAHRSQCLCDGTGYIAIAPDVGALLVAAEALGYDIVHFERLGPNLRDKPEGKIEASIEGFALKAVYAYADTHLDALIAAVAMALEAKQS